ERLVGIRPALDLLSDERSGELFQARVIGGDEDEAGAGGLAAERPGEGVAPVRARRPVGTEGGEELGGEGRRREGGLGRFEGGGGGRRGGGGGGRGGGGDGRPQREAAHRPPVGVGWHPVVIGHAGGRVTVEERRGVDLGEVVVLAREPEDGHGRLARLGFDLP